MRKYYQINNKSFQKEGVSTVKELWDKVKGEYEALSMGMETVFTKAEGDNKFHIVFSTANTDRHGDIVLQNWDLKHFKKNPVFLDSHNYDSIEHILGRVVKISVKDDMLQGDVEFALDNPKGLLAYKMALGGFLNTTSVGFIPLDFDEKGRINKSELLEVSAVSVPANAEALFEKTIKEIGEVIENVEPDTDSPTLPDEPELAPEAPKEEVKAVGILEKISKQMEEDRKILTRIAREMYETSPLNVEEKKRKIFKDLRELLSKDKSI